MIDAAGLGVSGQAVRLRAGRVTFGADRRWLGVMAGFALLELLWWALVWSRGIAPAPRIGEYLLIGSAGLALAWLLRCALRLEPAAVTWPAAVGAASIAALAASLFLPLKYAIPREVSFWLDQPLTTAERSLLGYDPWLALDRVLGWATVPMDWLYGCWLPVQSLVFFLIVLARPSPAKTRALIAYSAGWFALGIVGAVLLSSAGPIFFDRLFGSHAFAPLNANLAARGAWIAISESNAMWASFATAQPGRIAGISAVPSIHVAISLWMFLAARTMAPRWAMPALVYFILIWIGSVQLGWHYASDGLVGALGLLAIWMLARRCSGVGPGGNSRNNAHIDHKPR